VSAAICGEEEEAEKEAAEEEAADKYSGRPVAEHTYLRRKTRIRRFSLRK